jgi:aspartate racemase
MQMAIHTQGSIKSLGVMGGVGPLASAEFMKTIYEHARRREEQLMPAVYLYSDPTFPDRSVALLGGPGNVEIAGKLQQALGQLLALDVSRIVICCITLHAWLPALPSAIRERVISLVNVIMTQIQHSHQAHVLLCSSGTRRAGIFERDPKWRSVCDRVILPDEEDQASVHQLVYHIKNHGAIERGVALLEGLATKYGSQHFISGCTEMHLLVKHCRERGLERYSFLDPLSSIAQTWEIMETDDSRT